MMAYINEIEHLIFGAKKEKRKQHNYRDEVMKRRHIEKAQKKVISNKNNKKKNDGEIVRNTTQGITSLCI